MNQLIVQIYDKIRITEEMKLKAHDLAVEKFNKANELNLLSRFETNNKLHSEYIGFLGQIGAPQFAEHWGLEYKSRNIINGYGDKGIDIIINGKTVDVKSSKLDMPILKAINMNKWFLVNEYQAKTAKSDYFGCLRVSMNERFIYVMGFITPQETKEHDLRSNKYSRNYTVWMSSLYLPEKFT